MIKGYKDSSKIVKVERINKKDIWTIRLLILCGLTMMGIFVWWFINPDHIGYQPIYLLLTCALLFKLVKMLHEWYHYWSLSIPVPPLLKKVFSVDVLTTACPGEPREMIVRTLRAMQAIRYPHTSYLCDEGDDPELKKICNELGVIHVTRIEKINAKAGNINNALKHAEGEICLVLDPDHVPVPEFLDRVLPYFEDPGIGFVQCVQGYGNQSESLIAKGAAEQTYHFYGPMMMCMNSYGTVQAIGANCTFRRTALDSIDGHAAGLSEDMHTAMQLHAKGWRSVYIPEVLTRGLVPATLSAYYKQQLKWSRGTFELLFRTFPQLYKKFTWRQKIHYFTIPLYFLFGLINFIDILIPLLALSLAEVPWELNLSNFAAVFLPLCGMSMVIRLFAQRWLLEKHERGFHLAGGILRTATWWIFLVGFIYAIFKIKVPYIPTPKEDEHQNYWVLSIPNLCIVAICTIVVMYGLSIDWSPYSLAMAAYAIINAGMLGFIVFFSQQRFLDVVSERIHSVSALSYINKQVNALFFRTGSIIYGLFRRGPVGLLIGTALLFLSYSSVHNENKNAGFIKQKEIGGFYSGINLEGDVEQGMIKKLNASFGNVFEVIGFKQDWNTPFSEGRLKELKGMDIIPLINWELPDENGDMLMKITNGTYNEYLEASASEIRRYQNPVFLNFAAGFDENKNSGAQNSPDEFIKAWQYMYTFFNNLGISNVTWVWSPKHPSSIAYYPGPDFVDWIGVSCLNYGESKTDNDNYSFSELYIPFRNKLGVFQKPFIITEIGSVKGVDQTMWFKTAFSDIEEKYHEIHSVLLFAQQKIIVHQDESYTMNFKIDDLPAIRDKFSEDTFSDNLFFTASNQQAEQKPYHSAFVNGKPGNFKLILHGEPYYIKGVAYNTAHDWRDGNMPLTRRQVEKDMQKIKEMGANTIRRYDDGIYDKNVLNIAGEYGLNVLYGFWFDPEVDYFKDSVKVQEYMLNVENKVREFKDHSSLIAWSLGNETWGLLKHNYSKPYLTIVRQSYVRMIEILARRIHEIDPTRPVFSCMEHEESQLPGELAAFYDAAPSLDIIGVNSYYREQISGLNHMFYHFDSLRPYLISEFGPRGYWDSDYNRTLNKLLIEDNEYEKAEWYKEQWNDYVEPYDGYNVGGIAYCWHDRMEGSNTWFGLTDYKGRVKLPYYALKEMWTNNKEKTLPVYTISIPENIRPGMEYFVSAIASEKTERKVHYEWALHKSDYLEKVDALSSEESETAMVKIPEVPSDYRLYLYVSDEYGNVSTASVPIKVY